MLERDEIKIVLEMAIEKIENEKLVESIHNLVNAYHGGNSGSIQAQNQDFQKKCQSETWKEFSNSQINFLKSFDIYDYLGEANYNLFLQLTNVNYGNNEKIKNLLNTHAKSTIERLRSCKALLNAIEAGHFIENKEFNIDKYVEKEDLDAVLKGVNTILDDLKERLDLTEDEIAALKERTEELKEELKRKKPNRWKKIAEFSIHTAITECIKDPTKIKHALEAFGFIQDYVIQGAPIVHQLPIV